MIHHVFANRSNIGDWLSARGIQSLLKPEQVVEHLCDEPFVEDTLRELSKLGRDDLIVIGGGGLFMDYFTPFWLGLRDIARRVNVCIWGVGYCDLKSKPSRAPLELIRDCVEASRLCVVRDEMTRRHLEMDCVGKPVPCPSMVEIDPVGGGSGILHVDNFTSVGASAYALMDQVCEEFAGRTGRAFRKTNNRISHATELDRILSLYAASDVVVSSALHGCIIAVAMGKAVCAVSGDWKIEGFMDAAGLGEWVIDAKDAGRLEHLLDKVKTQEFPAHFPGQARAENQRVAAQIRSLGIRK